MAINGPHPIPLPKGATREQRDSFTVFKEGCTNHGTSLFIVRRCRISGYSRRHRLGVFCLRRLSATDGYTQADPTGVATGGVTVLQGPMPTQPTLFYDTFLYPVASTGTMTEHYARTLQTFGRIGSTNMNGNGQFVACQTSPAFGTGSRADGFIRTGRPRSPATYYLPAPRNLRDLRDGDQQQRRHGRLLGTTGGSDPIRDPYIRTGGTYYALNDTTYYGSVPSRH